MKEFHLTISTVSTRLFDSVALKITVPGSEGEITILPHHEALVTLLKKGTMKVVTGDGKEKLFPVEKGVLETSNNQVTILV